MIFRRCRLLPSSPHSPWKESVLVLRNVSLHTCSFSCNRSCQTSLWSFHELIGPKFDYSMLWGSLLPEYSGGRLSRLPPSRAQHRIRPAGEAREDWIVGKHPRDLRVVELVSWRLSEVVRRGSAIAPSSGSDPAQESVGRPFREGRLSSNERLLCPRRTVHGLTRYPRSCSMELPAD